MLREALQQITDHARTVFFGDSFRFDGRRMSYDEGINGVAFGFVFNPRTPYAPYADTGYTSPGLQSGPPQFYLGHNRAYSQVRPLGDYRVRFEVVDRAGNRDTLPIDVISRGLRITRLSITTRDPHRVERTRCIGRGCLAGGQGGGLEGRIYGSVYNVVWDTSGFNLEVEAAGHPSDGGALSATRWSVQFPGKVSSPEFVGRRVKIEGGEWPASNAAWGFNNLIARTRLDTNEVTEALPIRVFFPRDARVRRPGESQAVPNWFRYWLEVIRSTPGFSSEPSATVLFRDEGAPGEYIHNPHGMNGTVFLSAYNELDQDRVNVVLGPHRLFRQVLPCSRAALGARGVFFPESSLGDSAVIDTVGGATGLSDVSTDAGYCRVSSESTELLGIQALAYVWEHEVRHARHIRRMFQEVSAGGCAGMDCRDSIGVYPSGNVIRLGGPIAYWEESHVGRRLDCQTITDGTTVAISFDCYENIGRWLEFVADVGAITVPEASYSQLTNRDWAYPGSQYGR